MSDRVIVSITDGIAEVRLNRPDVRNAFTTVDRSAVQAAVRVPLACGSGPRGAV